MEQEQESETEALDTMEPEEPQKDTTMTPMQLHEFEKELLQEDGSEFADSNSGTFGQILRKEESAEQSLLAKAVRGEELSEDERRTVENELMRRQVLQISNEFEPFVAKVTGQNERYKSALDRAVREGKRGMLALLLIEFALQENKTEEEGELELMSGHKMHEFQERQIKESPDTRTKAGLVGFRMLKSLGFSEDVKNMSLEDIIKKVGTL